MYFYDVTAVIALVSELTYDIFSLDQVNQTRMQHLTSQINYEVAHPGKLLQFFQRFHHIQMLESGFNTAQKIIENIAGQKEKNRWARVKPQVLIFPDTVDLNFCEIITANKKLKKKIKFSKFIYHEPRSLLGV